MESRLDEAWYVRATEQLSALRHEATEAQEARRELNGAADALRYLVVSAPQWLPEALADPWREWMSCRGLTDPTELAEHAERTAVVLSDACLALRDEAVKALVAQDDTWCAVAAQLGGWLHRTRSADTGRGPLKQAKAAKEWLKGTIDDLRAERWRPFADQSQAMWNELRLQSNVSLESVALKGSSSSTLRKVAMDVSVDGMDASALSVMSQGELHSLALALFLPRATAPESPFKFVVIDDPVQSMDPAKVGGLARVLHQLGQTRQVVVFTHDTRLPKAFADESLPVTVFQVERGERSAVDITEKVHPASQALKDALDLVNTPKLPSNALAQVLPGICRTALEAALTEPARRQLRGAGCSEDDVDLAVEEANQVLHLTALALFGPKKAWARKARQRNFATEVYAELESRTGENVADVVKQCGNGVHQGLQSDPRAFIRKVEKAVTAVRSL